ncbi:branched-chain amino acid ABC transporter [Caballeronia fortuita]|uniref:Branched-chain amino acid ABC transporter n=1 Tax=Caballeronia fortuita TaxID=1777138 RepID=A0A158CDC4_9BURK|nr:ATP-binding cassette domain-containing protein [Caballeronia fortuita]SAK79517.1 branched-chain amino acid ABC transporter [Caballeronia fortuita]
MASSRGLEWLAQAAIACVLLSLPAWAGDYSATQVGLLLLYGMGAQSVALCWGRAGFLPLGQALFFGLAAYLSAYGLKWFADASAVTAIICVVVAAFLAGLLAYVIALMVFARRIDSGPFFSLITLALTMLGFLLGNQWSSVTGGFNGLTEVPDLPFTDRYGNLYYVIAVCAIFITAFLTWIVKRPIGVLWNAVAENENRLQFFGFATHRLKAVAFGIAAGIAGLGGALYAPHEGIVTPQALGTELSAQFVIWAAVGGRRSPLGAQLGALIIGLLAAQWRDQFSFWQVLIAAIFILVVRFFPEGLAGVGRIGSRLILGAKTASKAASTPIAAPTLNRDTRPQAAMPLLEFHNVEVSQSGVGILNGLSLTVQGKGISCVIGPNGAGKTSSFNAMTGRLPVKTGKVVVYGQDVVGRQAWQVSRLGVGRKFQIPSVFDRLSVEDNMRIAIWANRIRPIDLLKSSPLHWTSPAKARVQGRFAFIEERQTSDAGSLSQGLRQMLEFAMVATMEPKLYLLDEPCAGLSAHETHEMMTAIKSTVEESEASALVIEHDMSALERIADNVIVLHQGKKLATGSLEDIRASSEVKAVYAGGRK